MRSVFKHLVEAATCEWLFTSDFFKAKGPDTFNAVFAKTLSLCLVRRDRSRCEEATRSSAL